MSQSFKGMLLVLLSACLITTLFLAQAASDSRPFDLLLSNKCKSDVLVKLYSPATSGADMHVEQKVKSGEVARIKMDAEWANDTLQVYNNGVGGDVRIHLTNVLNDRNGSTAVAIIIQDANFSANAPQAVDIEWQR